MSGSLKRHPRLHRRGRRPSPDERDAFSFDVLLALLLGVISAAQAFAETSPQAAVDWVDPLIGTGGLRGAPRYAAEHPEYAGTTPAVTTPFGFTKWTPQTRQNRIGVAAYAYEDDRISGFLATHQPAIWMGDYGYVALMPEIGAVQALPEYRRMAFDHAGERSTPYGYSVRLTRGGQAIDVDMTATDHCGYLRFRFPAGVQRSVLVEATRPGGAGWVRFDPATGEISGYNPDRMDAHLSSLKLPNFRGYFVVRFRQQPTSGRIYQGARWAAGYELAADNVRRPSGKVRFWPILARAAGPSSRPSAPRAAGGAVLSLTPQLDSQGGQDSSWTRELGPARSRPTSCPEHACPATVHELTV